MEEFIEYREGKLYWKKSPSKRCKIGNEIGTLVDDYLRFWFKGKSYAVHRVVYFLHTGEWPRVVDHEDRNKLNNYFENLRAATHSQNSQNASLREHSSQYRGVSVYGNKWRAVIHNGHNQIRLGYFDDELVAAQAYDNAAKELFGEFASINFPE